MQIHNLKREHKQKTKKRVGRGGSRGKTSGRGTKGQKARAGGKFRPELRDIIKKLPKLRGYQFQSIYDKPVIVTTGSLEKTATKDTEVTPAYLVEQGLVRLHKGKMPKVKILHRGGLSKVVTIKGINVSKSVRDLVEKAGGTVVA
jgi:large subunit ribosomal protein L15